MTFAYAVPAPVLALLAGVGTWLMTALGASAVFFFSKENEKLLTGMLGFAAGVMLAASYWSLLAPAIDLAGEGTLPPWLTASMGFAYGAAFLWGTDRLLGRLRPREGNRTRLLILSITLHNIPEGLAVGVAFGALGSEPAPERLLAACAVALGIGIQNYPEGAAVSLPLLREGESRCRSFTCVAGRRMTSAIPATCRCEGTSPPSAFLTPITSSPVPTSGHSGTGKSKGFLNGFLSGGIWSTGRDKEAFCYETSHYSQRPAKARAEACYRSCQPLF